MRYLILLCFFAGMTEVSAQINFFKMYGGQSYDYGYDIAQTADSGFLITGRSGSFREGHSDAFLLKVTKSGFYEWSAPYGGQENDAAHEMVYVPNFGIYLIGSSNSWSNGDYDVYLAFTDESGNLLWEKTLELPDWEEGIEAALTLDSGLIVGVTKMGDNTLGNDIALMRFDKYGDTVWTQDFTLVGDDEVTNIERYRDSMFLISSNRVNSATEKSMAHLMLLHENGSIVWEDTASLGISDCTLNDFFVSNDTLFGLGGYRENDTMTLDIYNYRYFVDPINPYNIQTFGVHGAAEWEGDVITNYSNSPYRYGAYRVEGSFTSPGGTDIHIGRHFYTLGWLTGVGYIDFEGPDRMYEAIPTSDGGAVMVGYTSGGYGGASIVVVKIGEGEVYPTIQGVTFVDQLVGLNTVPWAKNVQLYPNPASSEITIVSEQLQAAKYTILASNGRRLQEGSINSDQETVALENLASGVYLLQLIDQEMNAITLRFVVQ